MLFFLNNFLALPYDTTREKEKQTNKNETKQNKHYDQYVGVGGDIATAKYPITAGPCFIDHLIGQ